MSSPTTRDRDGLREIFAPDLRFVDRRLIGWGEREGRDTYLDLLWGAFALMPDGQIEGEPLAVGERAGVGRYRSRGHLADGGGEYEIEVVVVSLVDEGRVTYFETFDGDDAASALVRFEAQTEPERVYSRLCGRVNARDWSALSDCYTEDFEAIDHRPLAWEPRRGPAAMLDFYRSWIDVAPDVEARFETLAGDDEHVAMRFGGYGHAADGGGAMEYVTTQVATVRKGRFVRGEVFGEDDAAGALARLAELMGG